jgi:hypothetical protein
MVAINTILIIVNGGPPGAVEHQRITPNAHRIVELLAEKGGKLAARAQNVPLTTSVIGWPGSGAGIVRFEGLGLCHAASPATDQLDAIAAAGSR